MPKRISAALAGALALTLLAASAAAADQEYVALGDSYSSGTGTGEYYNEPCKRSNRSFAQIIDRERPNTKVVLAACSGAETGDVLRNQLGALGATTRWVTITIGGNDAGFARVVAECAKPRWAGRCGERITEARHFIKRALPERLTSVYEAIGRQAPNATAVVLSYPRLFKGEDCDAGTFFSEREMERLNDTAELLRDKTSRYARAAPGASASVTRSRCSPATRSAPATSGSTGSSTRSPRATTRTAPATGPATRPWCAR